MVVQAGGRRGCRRKPMTNFEGMNHMPRPAAPSNVSWVWFLLAVLGLATITVALDKPVVLIDAQTQGLSGWNALWTRAADTGNAAMDDQEPQGGRPTIRVAHTGQKDWSLARTERLPVEAGDIFEITTALKVEGTGDAAVGTIAYDQAGKSVDWFLGGVRVKAGTAWQLVKTRLVVPKGVATIQPRVTGDGPAVVHIAGLVVRKIGNVRDLRSKDLPAKLELSNKTLTVTLDTANATLQVTGRRNTRNWSQQVTSAG